MNIAPIRPILRSTMPATHLVNNLPGKRRRRKPRPRHRPLPILIHKPRHSSPGIHLPPTANTALRSAAKGSKFHLSKLTNLPVHSPRLIEARNQAYAIDLQREPGQGHTPNAHPIALNSLDNRRRNLPTLQNRNVWPKNPSTECEV
jgi:hypothetical protein